MNAPPTFLTQPERDLRAWTTRFDPTALPVLAETALMLETWRANEEAVDAHLMSQTIVRDPLMMLKLFALVARTARRRPSWSGPPPRPDPPRSGWLNRCWRGSKRAGPCRKVSVRPSRSGSSVPISRSWACPAKSSSITSP